MQSETPFNYFIDSFLNKVVAQKGRALVSHSRGTGTDAPHLQLFRKDRHSKNELGEAVLLDQKNIYKYV